MKLRRQYQTIIDAKGVARIDITPNNAAMEWKIFQVPIFTETFVVGCVGAVFHNDSYLHSTPNGSLDAAAGPPYPIVGPGDVFTVSWTGGHPGDQATVTIWYEENPAGTSQPT